MAQTPNSSCTKREDYLSWDEVFMQMAFLIAKRSKDPNTQNGACIVDEDNIIIGLGYNGFPRRCSDNVLPWAREGSFLEKKYAYVVHAEANAIFNSNKSVKYCRIYSTLFPCNECTKAIIQCGIKEIIYACDPYHNNDEWIASRKMLDLAGVKVRCYIPEYELEVNKKQLKLDFKESAGELAESKETKQPTEKRIESTPQELSTDKIIFEEIPI